ncbi:MAG: sulfate ABC transporter ATP-binding protein [Candidatus Krumholzibacteria bacterium]|nr:sulfate ABC transporter ATP-binding protein [Candidatus Krumholzibacteria bacterium]
MSIQVRNITKRFGPFTALEDVSLDIPTGELVALLGPSGCGKTTLLRIIAGLEAPDSGQILFEGEDVARQSARRRQVGFVFQHYALFRHMTVFENVAFGLTVRPRRQRPPKDAIRRRVRDLLRLVQLEHFADRLPTQLSGGQRQRVALARALAIEPKVLLLDEPFGALDAKVRQELRRWLRRLHDEIHVTSVFVTHDQEEALEVADYAAVMNQGRVEQIGRPEEVYHDPATPFVYNFLGNVNVFHGPVEDGKLRIGNMRVDLPEGQSNLRSATIYVRPHQLDIGLQPTDPNHFRARTVYINPAGPTVKVELVSEWGDTIHVELSQERYEALQLRGQTDVFVFLKRKRMTLWSHRRRTP